MKIRPLIPSALLAQMIVISSLALGRMLFGVAGPAATQFPNAASGVGTDNSAQILSLWPVNGATPGVTVKLWAQVENISLYELPSNANVWFWVTGPNWSDTHWVGSASTAGLVSGIEHWYAFDWPIPANAPVGNYTYWAQVWTTTAISDWSAGQGFGVSKGGTPGKATLISPRGLILSTTPTYTWTAVASTTWYYLWVNDSSGSPKIQNWYTAEQVGCALGTGNCYSTPPTALARGLCQWWIQSYNQSGYGPWSDALSFTVNPGGPYGIEFVTIPAGEFQMGTANGGFEEQPLHRVMISKSFQLGKYEITQGQWKAAMGTNPSYFKGDDSLPVDTVSWNDAQAFIAKLGALNDGYLYRLPTEAEWEYACRAGSTGDYAGNLDEMGWYFNNSGGKMHPVGLKKPNAWGLYDMHGNAFEWVQDWGDPGYYSVSPVVDPPGPSTGSERVIRGGSWYHPAALSRSASRRWFNPGISAYDSGFRIVRTPTIGAINVALRKPAIASGEYTSFASNGNDGDLDTGWNGGDWFAWWQVDLRSILPIDSVVVHGVRNSQITYKVEYSVDGRDWTYLGGASHLNPGAPHIVPYTDSFDAHSSKMRFIRWTSVPFGTAGGFDWANFAELETYSSTSVATSP